MKKFVVLPVNGYKNILPREEVVSGSEQTALKKFLQSHQVPFNGINHVTSTTVKNLLFDGWNNQQIEHSVDFIVDTKKNIDNGLVIDKKRSNAYKLY